MSVKSVIIGTGAYLPQKIMTNAELAEKVDTSDEWIQTRTGIKQRHIANKEETVDFMATKAARAALKAASLTADDIDMIIVATVSGGYSFPAVGCFVQKNLGGMRTIPAFDIQAACSGFMYALHMAEAQIKTKSARRILVIGAEKFSSLLDWEDRTTCILFGDGAGAVVLEGQEETQAGILSSKIEAEGTGAEHLITTGGVSTTGDAGIVKMNGREVYKHAVRRMANLVTPLLEDAGQHAQNINWIVPHQANLRIIESVATSLGLSSECCIQTVAEHANTSAASIPLALDEAAKKGQFKTGDLLLLTAFGAGFTWGGALLRWA